MKVRGYDIANPSSLVFFGGERLISKWVDPGVGLEGSFGICT